MFIFRTAVENIRRHKRKSILFFMACLLLSLIMQVILINLQVTEREYLEIRRSIPVTGRVTNLTGTSSSRLVIPEKNIAAIENCDFLKDKLYQAPVWFTNHEIDSKDVRMNNSYYGLATNSAEATSYKEITWLEGESEKSLSDEELKIIVSKPLLEAENTSLGKDLDLYIHYQHCDAYDVISYDFSKQHTFRIIGFYTANDNEQDRQGADILVPYKAITALHKEEGRRYLMDGASFSLVDPAEINAVKEEMKKTGYLSIAPGAVPSRKGNALLFEDSTFIKTATNFEDNIRLNKIFLPVLLGALLVVIYLLVNMLMQSRREEYLLYRVMGMRRRSVGVLFCLEHILIALGGVIVSLILSMIMGGTSWMQGAILSLLVLLCICVGTMIALVSIGRNSLMLAVQKND
ncbi:hypothetical protein M2145_002782 [Lachnospiraceae bacterium PF1-21]|uniref:ABC3 transporter permease C-terminal domain-containing protein n=1 Tax=Ohessyouella blattaphilus TaxID=2949333 RepID=A0ABT1EK27_9FIRM|nr:FtsX-like permease family protein [Ohessyouella blattaphilus]MCP1111056.1 hypothetical protein [Ohessyouella blattaphilus]MCR8564450.1 hypothetical protein [Ohessyouella blattaphilus]